MKGNFKYALTVNSRKNCVPLRYLTVSAQIGNSKEFFNSILVVFDANTIEDETNSS
jgi:hypothetical protein